MFLFKGGENTIDGGLTRNNNITLEERPPSFSVIANDVIDRVDDGMPIHLINISRVSIYLNCVSLFILIKYSFK